MFTDRIFWEADDEGAGGSEPVIEEPAADVEEPESAPEQFTREDITLPEGAEFDDEAIDSFVELLNSDMSRSELATALVELQLQTHEKMYENLAETWKNTQEEWREESHKVLGENLEPALAGISQLIDEYGDREALSEVLNLTGAGNHPAVIQFLAKIADVLVKEGEPVLGAPASAPADRAHRMFPNMS